MSAAGTLVRRWESTARYDYGQFYLFTPTDPDTDAEDVRVLVDRAIENDGIAQGPGQIVVLSPFQWSSDMALAVELWSGPPPNDTSSWQEGFETTLTIAEASGRSGLCYDTVDGDLQDFGEVPPGTYWLRIIGRGFDGTRNEGDSWRVQLWPTTQSRTPTRTARWRPAIQPEPPDPEVLEAARLAAERINADLSGASGRSRQDQSGTVRVKEHFAVSASQLFPYAADLGLWSTASSSRRGGLRPGGEYRLSSNDYRDGFDGIPTGDAADLSHVHATYLTVEAPLLIETQWRWCTGPFASPDAVIRSTLAEPTLLRTRLNESTDEHGNPVTTMNIEHSGLPRAWVEDMTAVWKCKLHLGRRTFRPGFR